ncbi:TIGR03118 family protein [Chitinophaga qingshengii]|uniref:TIGR03118 family protein n=1 Tax=Chitinophaga qingshengii TaxID=1569794 RepID=A0ABR7TKN3_9BACT|nr:TIGR03118 family protein [Chitinophaga qingshengii]MBC9930528.1 TIGR03118 family protein [Chitinophaga qingshengii]
MKTVFKTPPAIKFARICQKILHAGMAVTVISFLLTITSCRKNDHHPGCGDCDCVSGKYKQTNLVADTAGFNATRIDPHLINAWGIAVGSTGIFWLSSNGDGSSVVYDKGGMPQRSPVFIPSPSGKGAGAPTGVVFNNTTSFNGARFLFATEDGTILSWTSGDSAVIKADRSAFNAVYKGIALASDSGKNYIYATNFHNGTIDVFDTAYHYISSKPFRDPDIPAGFAPFNIRNIDGVLFVTYAKQKPDRHDDQAGPGNGYVDIYKPNGTLIRRFATQGTLNSPWGITPGCSGNEDDDVILIGNFGDGHINAYNMRGTFLGQLQKNTGPGPVIIDGLWGLESNVPSAPGQLFFTAGPKEESHGLFGYLKR